MARGRKLRRRLATRIRDYENTMQGNSDIKRKHPQGFKKPGSLK